MDDLQTINERESWIKSSYKALRDKIYFNIAQPLIASRNTPHYDALGVSVGLFVGLGAPLGSHMLILGLLRLVFKFNVIVAFGFTFVINPLDAIPMYYGYYLLGSLALGERVSLSFETFRKTMTPVLESQYFWESILTFFRLGEAIFLRWLTAAICLSVTFGILAYALTYFIQRKRLCRVAKNLSQEYQHLVMKLHSSDCHTDIQDKKIIR